jgi:glycerophosphoryl diester phosphodiesterase
VGPSPDGGLLVIGHRGASAHAPENTHAAFERAFADGADGIEFDVRLASDGVPFVFHDATFERTVGIYGDADRFPSTTLEKFYVGAWFNERYPRRARVDYEWGEKIPTLAQVFERYGSHLLYAEMKCEDVTRRPALARAVVELIHRHDLSARVVVKSFALDSLREVKRLAPEVRTAALFGRSWPRPFLTADKIIAGAEACGADQISLHRSLLRGATVEAARRRGFEVLVWTVNTPASLRRALKLNLRAVITDYPGRMRGSLTRLRAEAAARGEKA